MTQKELKVIYREELSKAWSDPAMVDHCAKNTAYIVEHNGCLYSIEKPSIETRFCFGAGMYARCTDEEMDRAEHMVEVAQTKESFFIRENMVDINKWIKTLRDIRHDMSLDWSANNHPQYMVYTGPKYWGQTEDCKLTFFTVENTWSASGRGIMCEDLELIEKLIEGYKQVKQDFEKRLHSYLKRYGLSKVEAWSYIRD